MNGVTSIAAGSTALAQAQLLSAVKLQVTKLARQVDPRQHIVKLVADTTQAVARQAAQAPREEQAIYA